MPRYMIHDSHTKEDCLDLLDEFLRAGAHYLTRADWGCLAGVHDAWIVVEAENEAEARHRVPPIIRNRASVVEMARLTPEQIRAFHDAEK
jgi:hypothetical protein